MIIKKSKFLLTLILLSSLSLSSQVKIKLSIEDNVDSVYYLLKYKGDKIISTIDSCSYSDNYIIKNKNKHEEGIYVIADKKKNPLLEILIDKDQKFSLKIDNLMDVNTYKVKGCKVTSDYFDIYAKTIHYNLYIKALESEIDYNIDNKNKIDSLSCLLYKYQESKIKKNNSFLNTYIKFIEKIIVPEQIKNDAAKSKNYIMEHYFDEIPLCDRRILNSHLLKNKLDDYFNHIIASESSEYTCDKIDNIIKKVYNCQDVRDYILWNMYSRYFIHDDLKHENTFIHLVDNYFSKLEIENLTPNIRDRIVKRADILRDITIGKPMPNIDYINKNGDTTSLKDIEKENVIVLFYKTDCQKCHKAKRILSLIEDKYKNIEFVTINITDEIANHEIVTRYDIMNVPSIFVLDKERKIITKNIEAEEVELYLTR